MPVKEEQKSKPPASGTSTSINPPPLIELKSMKSVFPSNQIIAIGDQPYNLSYSIESNSWSKLD